MIKQNVTYYDYNDNEINGEFYFHLNKLELEKLNLKYPEGLEAHVTALRDSNNVDGMIDLFTEIVLMAYGVKSEDGTRFIKSKQLTEEFSQTEAFPELFYKLATEEGAATAFIRGIIPKNMEHNA